MISFYNLIYVINTLSQLSAVHMHMNMGSSTAWIWGTFLWPHSLKNKSDYPSPSSHLQIAPNLKLEPQEPAPPPSFTRIFYCLILFRSCVGNAYYSVFLYITIMSCPEDNISHILSHLLALHYFCPFFCDIL